MLKPHPSAPLEYWFFKVNAAPVALLVDWICRRTAQAGVLRISIHSPQGREVLESPHPAILRHGAAELAMEEASWPRGDVRWHLAIKTSMERVRPQLFPAEHLKLFDMSLESAPFARFNGWIEHRGEQYPVVNGAGMLSHYWGRRLPADWWWVSANQFGNADVCVECTILRSGIWGAPPAVPLGYFYYRNGPRRVLMVSPPGRLRIDGTPDAFEIRASVWRGPEIVLRAKGRDYGSLGEGIINTLTGDLEVWEGGKLIAQADRSAGLERRANPENASA